MVAADGESHAAGLREVGHEAAWSVTSAKPGNGIELLRDGRKDTFWQSDGLQPHLINLQFPRRMDLQELHIYLDYKLDESYTPSKISVRAGTGLHDVKEIRIVELSEPSGWIVIPLGVSTTKASDMVTDQPQHGAAQPLQTFFLQIAVVANHQNGRDTHMREIKVFGQQADSLQAMTGLPLGITSTQMGMYSSIR